MEISADFMAVSLSREKQIQNKMSFNRVILRKTSQNSQRAINFRNFIFGVEDSLVSTVGLLSGVASAQISKSAIFITGFILILVEAISMAAGSFLSESSMEDYVEKEEVSSKKSFRGALIMFFSYLVAGFIPLLPYGLTSLENAFKISIELSLFFLVILGIVGSRFTKTSTLKSVLRMSMIGGGAILIGIIAGRLLAGLTV